ncbi:unnamed protein product [Caenorhabditis auriculariae]|uniref:C2 domain-containing protein n=1 Tax=Caenorhabditis auriculariae TaxID=2777116 RepID=A0A8S1HP68_9PELO|nr:unnamed protein product [Caenorhabditis auriculariae]
MNLSNLNFADMEKSVYGGNVEEDEELLAELAALQEEEMGARRPPEPTRPTGRPAAAQPPQRGPKAPVGGVQAVPGLDPKALAAALADDPEDVDDDALEMDDDLMNELSGLVGGEAPATTAAPPLPTKAGPTTNPQIAQLRQLHKAYSECAAQSEKAGEGAKARRYKRTVEKLVELISSAERGKTIMPGEIPVPPPNFQAKPTTDTTETAHPAHHAPAPSLREAAAAPEPTTAPPPLPARGESRTAPQVAPSRQPPPIPSRTASSSSQSSAAVPRDDKKEKFRAILQHRRDLYVANGKAAIAAKDKMAAKEAVTTAKAFDEALAALDTVSADDLDLNEIPPSPQPYRKAMDAPGSSAPSAPPPAQPRAAPAPAAAPKKPATFIEALQQRQAKYLEMAEKAKREGNDRKHRMNSRLAGQYGDAVKEAKAGRPVDISELPPATPDMPPLPPQTAGAPPKAGPAPGMKPPPAVGPLAPSGVEGKSRNSNQLEFLLQRQEEFKQAAIHAKTRGDIETAKKYLLEAKGFDKMIQAARAGLPVSIKQTPIPPQAHTASATLQPRIQPSSTSVSGVEGRGERLALMEKTLIEQVRLAETNQMRFTRLGDVGKVRLFETWAKASKQDLLLVRAVAQGGHNVPKFHYEMRQIPSADMFPDLAEDVIELKISGCRDVPLPSGYEPHHANLYIKYTFPYPTETPQTGKTKYVADTTSPAFNESVMLQIGSGKSRNSKLLRAFKRGTVKFEVFQKGGFMRSDKLLGTAEWKIDALESAAELEESLPLKEGRKAVGGLVSARLRIREPIGDAKAQSLPQKWLILDD